MYYPYFRGKLYDLITIRENAELLASNGFIPIVEPVKQPLNGLTKTIEAINSAQGKIILIVNPTYGDHVGDCKALNELLLNTFKSNGNILVGILLSQTTTIADIQSICDLHKNSRQIAFIHNGFTNASDLNTYIHSAIQNFLHIFIEKNGGKLYRGKFKDTTRILLRDSFEKRANRAYEDTERFSELHLTYPDEGMNGFGDFLIVSDEFSESGGPAYAVAIHITFIDDDDDDVMYIHHFKSDRFDTPTDPAGKFAEALAKLDLEVNSGTSKVKKTEAILEFLDLKSRGHFPGLGYVKKLSMQHHLETIADFLSTKR